MGNMEIKKRLIRLCLTMEGGGLTALLQAIVERPALGAQQAQAIDLIGPRVGGVGLCLHAVGTVPRAHGAAIGLAPRRITIE